MDTILVLVFYDLLLYTSAEQHWSYEDQNSWCGISKTCCGSRQSPIELKSSKFLEQMPKFKFTDYDEMPKEIIATNSDQTINYKLIGVSPRISGGGLNHPYHLHSFHFHVGLYNDRGSEHIIDNQPGPMELHLVHYNSKYKNLAHAVASNEFDAVAVLAVIYKINDTYEYFPIQMNYSKGQVNGIKAFALRELLPKSTKEFFRYSGSLTTPMCDEVVVWTVFKEPSYVTNAQLKAFRSTMSTVGNNYRDVQELNSRKVVEGV